MRLEEFGDQVGLMGWCREAFFHHMAILLFRFAFVLVLAGLDSYTATERLLFDFEGLREVVEQRVERRIERA